MSLRINQNIAAQSAHRWMAANDTSMSKSIERLSSGFRINSAADDAAGLVISESLRTQISGLDVANRNTQSGINVIKTTEKALDEITNQLRTIRNLALDAANANGNKTQMASDQAQVTKALAAINRIADQTEFAGMKLLSDTAPGHGNIEGAKFQIGANAGQDATFSVAGLTFNSQTLTADMHAASLDSNFASVAGAYAKVDAGAAYAGAAIADTETLSFNITWQKADGTVDEFKIDVTNNDVNGDGSAMDIDQATAEINTQLKAAGYDGKLEATNAAGKISIGVVDRLENINEQSGASKLSVSVENDTTAGNTAGFTFATISDTGTTATAGITIDETTNYTNLLGYIQNAMDKVNGLRVNLGAFQTNTLESNLTSLQVTKENLSASESNIRDTDMAEEMTNFTRSQILMQAAQAMMTQANQAPQNILQMLR